MRLDVLFFRMVPDLAEDEEEEEEEDEKDRNREDQTAIGAGHIA